MPARPARGCAVARPPRGPPRRRRGRHGHERDARTPPPGGRRGRRCRRRDSAATVKRSGCARDHLEGLGADRAGGAEDGDGAGGHRPIVQVGVAHVVKTRSSMSRSVTTWASGWKRPCSKSFCDLELDLALAVPVLLHRDDGPAGGTAGRCRGRRRGARARRCSPCSTGSGRRRPRRPGPRSPAGRGCASGGRRRGSRGRRPRCTTTGHSSSSAMSLSVSVTIGDARGLVADVAVQRHLLQVVDEHHGALPGLLRDRARRPRRPRRASCACPTRGCAGGRRTPATVSSAVAAERDLRAGRRPARAGPGRSASNTARTVWTSAAAAGCCPAPRRPPAASRARSRWSRLWRVVLEGEHHGVPTRRRRRCGPSARPSSSCRSPRCHRAGRARRSAGRRRGSSRGGRSRSARPGAPGGRPALSASSVCSSRDWTERSRSARAVRTRAAVPLSVLVLMAAIPSSASRDVPRVPANPGDAGVVTARCRRTWSRGTRRCPRSRPRARTRTA